MHISIQKKKVDKVVITSDKLDPICVFPEDLGPGRGQIVITCYGSSWTYYWGSMGENTTIREFIRSRDDHYLGGKLCRGQSSEVDYYAISDKVGEEVTRESAMCQSKELSKAYGSDWYMDLPQMPTNEWSWLMKILPLVREAFAVND